MSQERQRYHSIPLRKQAPKGTVTQRSEVQTRPPDTNSYVSSAVMPVKPTEDGSFQTRIPNSAFRYRDTEGHEVIQQGSKRIVIHHEARQRGHRGLFVFGAGAAIALLLYGAINLGTGVWTQHQLDVQYGFPRTWQTDQVVGYADNAAHPTHFIFENLNTHIIFIEIPGGDIAKAKIYSVEVIHGNGADDTPVTATFADVNGDSKIDVIVNIGDQSIVYLNTGTGFAPQQ